MASRDDTNGPQSPADKAWATRRAEDPDAGRKAANKAVETIRERQGPDAYKRMGKKAAATKEYLEEVRRYVASGRLQAAIRYKLGFGAGLVKARDAVVRNDPDWPRILDDALLADTDVEHYAIYHVNRAKFLKWKDAEPERARDALRDLWEGDAPTAERVRAFSRRLPWGAETPPENRQPDRRYTDLGINGPWSRLALISALLMATDALRHPPLAKKYMLGTYSRREPQAPERAEDESAEYERAMAFFDQLIDEARRKGIDHPRDRLEAQTIVQAIHKDDSLDAHGDDGTGDSAADRERWARYLEEARRYVESGLLDSEEVDYKLAIELKLREARRAVLEGDENCLDLVAKAISNNLASTYDKTGLRNWFREQPEEAREALQAIWAEDGGLSTADRIRAFTPLIPETLPSGRRAPTRGTGTRLRWIALLLMARGASQFPPYKVTEFAETYERTGHPPPAPDGDEATHYEHALGFLDELVRRARESGLERPKDRLEAQSVLFAVAGGRGAAPESADDRPCWFVGASWDTGDQTDRFVQEGIWQNGYEDRYLDHVKEIEPGDRIAIKATYVRKRGLPFDNRGEDISTMAIKATGVVIENMGDGRNLRVDWRPSRPRREWYFYVYQPTVWKVTRDSGTIPWAASALIDFAFDGAKQDYDRFLRRWYSAWFDDPDNNDQPDVRREAQSKRLEEADFSELAPELLYDEADLQKIATLLDDKRQVIFQGPPGTGKTYAARELARFLAESAEPVTIVQFHPSYAYEDFVQGYRPTLNEEGQARFELRDGPLVNAARKARDEPGTLHFLIIDEINRGNLAKVFGELYFLLEYRDEDMRLQYASADDEPFSLPENLYIIGTMNTADRSIALVDLALRRRFHFVEFHPDKAPVEGLLGRWLEKNSSPEMAWVADVMKRANSKLNDRQAAIGPSYFMKGDLDEEKVRLIWEHNVLPYVEEHLYGETDRLAEFDLDKLRRLAGDVGTDHAVDSDPNANAAAGGNDDAERNEEDGSNGDAEP
ncbi:MAG: AAA domain-containing protein [Holophagales bacterium]|nr:AAA domain-containing protein [Holophagales bacterium]MYF96929.1 AAA domain-containing protein [Holophagales bacterium]